MSSGFFKRRSVQAGCFLVVAACLGWPWLKTQPAGIESGIVTGAIALFGVLVGLEAHSERERESRETEMKRQVYFDLAASVVERTNVLVQYANPALTDSDLFDVLKRYSERAAKFHLVAKMKGIKELNQLELKYLDATHALGKMRLRLINLKASHEALNRQVTDFGERIKSVWKPELHGENPSIAALMPHLTDVLKREKVVMIGMEKLCLEIIIEARKQLALFVPAQAEAVLIARKELGFEMSEEEYRAEFKEHFEETGTKIEAYVAELRQELNETQKT